MHETAPDRDHLRDPATIGDLYEMEKRVNRRMQRVHIQTTVFELFLVLALAGAVCYLW